MDSLILYLVIIFTIMLFSFILYHVKKKRLSKIRIFQNRNIEVMGNLENVKYNKYDQIKEFIPDTYNYDIEKDSGIIRSIDNQTIF